MVLQWFSGRHVLQGFTSIQGLYSLSGNTSYRQISWGLKAARLDVIMTVSLWNLTDISAALLPRCLSNFSMMTSSNGNIFHVTGPLCGEFTGQRWILRTKASDAELWCFLWYGPEYTKTLICCVYKHPKVSNAYFKQCVSNICDKITPGSDDVIIIGDMNCCPTKSTLIKDICDVYGLTNLIKHPTCHKGTSPTLLDVILVSNAKRYVDVLNEKFDISDHHNIIGAATRRHAPSQKPKRIYYRSYKHFCENDYLDDIASAPFHVARVFDDIDDIAWFHSSLIRNVIDSHAPVKSKIMIKRSVPYMNSKLRKAQFARNMARNKFKRFGKYFWEENKRHRNNVVNIRKKSLSNYFATRCEKHDKRFWNTVSPFMSDKKFRNGGGIILEEGDETISEASKVSEIFN